MSKTTHCQRVLAVLGDGLPHSTSELYRRAGPMILHSRVAELRKRGHTIVCEHVSGKHGAAAYRYTWLDAPPQKPAERGNGQLRLSTDEVAPRIQSERYRIFRVRNGGPPEIVATVGTPEAIGVALLTLGREGEFEDYCVGVQDVFAEKGKQWVIRPWVAYG